MTPTNSAFLTLLLCIAILLAFIAGMNRADRFRSLTVRERAETLARLDGRGATDYERELLSAGYNRALETDMRCMTR